MIELIFYNHTIPSLGLQIGYKDHSLKRAANIKVVAGKVNYRFWENDASKLFYENTQENLNGRNNPLLFWED